MTDETRAPKRQENEDWYDKEVAPVLAEIAKKCIARDMSFVANVGNGLSEVYSTTQPTESMGPAMRIVYIAARCNGNADTLIFSLLSDAERHGHNSVYISQLKNLREKNK